MPISAHDVARELRRRLPGIGAAKLQKLLYYCQGWHIVGRGEPMFEENIEAWAMGPVVATLWADERHSRPTPDPQPLDDEAVATIDYVLERYGRMSGQALIRQTHQEQPWRAVTEVDDDGWVPANPVIPHDLLADWFGSDPEHQARTAEARRLRERNIFNTPIQSVTGLAEAVQRARSGQRVRHSRPA